MKEISRVYQIKTKRPGDSDWWYHGGQIPDKETAITEVKHTRSLIQGTGRKCKLVEEITYEKTLPIK
jgi:hypothetical protein